LPFFSNNKVKDKPMKTKLVNALLVAGMLQGCGTPSEFEAAEPPNVEDVTELGESESEINALSVQVVEKSLTELQRDLSEGRYTSHQLVRAYLQRINRLNPKVNGIITINPRALQEASVLDKERRAGKLRGPLHGIPVAVKDNIDTAGLRTTGGAIAFQNRVPDEDAALVKRLKEGGAIVLAKTTMTELANYVSTKLPIGGGWNAIKGHSLNPYDLRPDPREGYEGQSVAQPLGSSSGVGTTLSFWGASVGTETFGSIISPSLFTMLVGLKPTLGRVSRSGIIPLSLDQDTAGPMGRTVSDVAVMLGAMEDRAKDRKDSASGRCSPAENGDYLRFLKDKDLTGVRIGVPRAFFTNPVSIDGTPSSWSEFSELVAPGRLDKVVAVLKARGATIVENADLPSYAATNSDDNQWYNYACTTEAKGPDSKYCSNVLRYSFRRDFNAWLKSNAPSTVPVQSLSELIEFNKANAKRAIPYGQDIFVASNQQSTEADEARYAKDRKRDLRLAEATGLKAAMDTFKVDALVFPDYSSVDVSAIAGYPNIVVPAGKGRFTNKVQKLFGEPLFPDNFEIVPVPWGVTFVARPCQESTLLKIAYHYEQGSKAAGLARVPPPEPK
jgi:amidase